MAQQVQNSSLQGCYVPNHLATETREGEVSALGNEVILNSAEDVKELQDICARKLVEFRTAVPFSALLGAVLLIAGIVAVAVSVIFPPLLPFFIPFSIFIVGKGISLVLDSIIMHNQADKLESIKEHSNFQKLVNYANTNDFQLIGRLGKWDRDVEEARKDRLLRIFDHYQESQTLTLSSWD